MRDVGEEGAFLGSGKQVLKILCCSAEQGIREFRVIYVGKDQGDKKKKKR